MSTNATMPEVLANLSEALAEFARSFSDAQTINDVSGHLGCSEVDSLAQLLHAAGNTTSAVRWLVAHGRSDHEEDDWHHDITDDEAAELLRDGEPEAEEPAADAPDPATSAAEKCEQHKPDDLPDPGDRCKYCGKDITWVGPGDYDWVLAYEEEGQ